MVAAWCGRRVTVSKKQFFLLVDTETTVQDMVADFGAVVCDRKGNTYATCAVMVRDTFEHQELFYNPADTGFWGKTAAEKRKQAYLKMLTDGSRMLASVAAINRWLEKVSGKYNPMLTAYNLAFDADKCGKTGIDLAIFPSRFCLWAAAATMLCVSKPYRNFAAAHHLFNAPTAKGNMTYKTDAESVAGFVTGELTKEPHTAYEDAIQYELPILKAILKRKQWQKKINAYDWKAFQVRDHFIAR